MAIKILKQQVFSTGIVFNRCVKNKLVMPSSVVAAMKYDSRASKLRVIYTSGSIYDYLKVPEEVYKAMRAAFSKGEFLNKHIKPNYEYQKVKD